ncbi:MAG: glycoside hydrolase family 15 protein, partial [Candidatus Saccharimonadales bacterium]
MKCKTGEASLTFIFDPAPEYARGSVSWQIENDKLVAAFGQGTLILHLPNQSVVLHKTKSGFDIKLEIKSGETKELILEYQPIDLVENILPKKLEQVTVDFWRDWVNKGNFVTFCRDKLIRSAITLKLMQFAPTGAIIAAPTTSLPETVGGIRNWDYRYVWIRDATFTLYALHTLGYYEEAERFFDFIHSIVEKCADRQFDISLMYTIFGEAVPAEESLDGLSGYMKSKPVRLGNGAARQFQLDVYGSLIDAVYFATKRGLTSEHKGRMRKLVMNLVDKIEQTWQDSD